MMKISISKMSVAMVNAGVDSSKRLAEVAGVSVNTIKADTRISAAGKSVNISTQAAGYSVEV